MWSVQYVSFFPSILYHSYRNNWVRIYFINTFLHNSAIPSSVTLFVLVRSLSSSFRIWSIPFHYVAVPRPIMWSKISVMRKLNTNDKRKMYIINLSISSGDPRIPALDQARRAEPAGRASPPQPYISPAGIPSRGHWEKTRGVQDLLPGWYQGTLSAGVESFLRGIRQ